jgi:hypothetical protein
MQCLVFAQQVLNASGARKSDVCGVSRERDLKESKGLVEHPSTEKVMKP